MNAEKIGCNFDWNVNAVGGWGHCRDCGGSYPYGICGQNEMEKKVSHVLAQLQTIRSTLNLQTIHTNVRLVRGEVVPIINYNYILHSKVGRLIHMHDTDDTLYYTALGLIENETK